MDRNKFKFWNPKTKSWVDDVYISGDGWHYTQSINDHQPELIRCDCTGLKDKNGVLIFEGDIVELDYYGKYIIKWSDDGGVGFTTDLIGKVEELFMIQNDFDNDCSTSYQVIGNIHENPELLEQ